MSDNETNDSVLVDSEEVQAIEVDATLVEEVAEPTPSDPADTE